MDTAKKDTVNEFMDQNPALCELASNYEQLKEQNAEGNILIEQVEQKLNGQKLSKQLLDFPKIHESDQKRGEEIVMDEFGNLIPAAADEEDE